MAWTQTDVLIVGAGPAGLTLAAALRGLGVDALLIEKRADVAQTSRAAVVHARTLEVLEEINVTSALITAGVRVPTFQVRDRDRSLLKVSFTSLETRYPFTVMCPQDVTERILRERLDELGLAVHRPVELVSLAPSGSEVCARLQGPDGASEVSAIRWVVGCDGAHSVVRTEAGIPFEGGDYEEAFVLADVRMDWPLSREEVDLFFSPAGLMVVAPLPEQRFRIVATVESAPDAPDASFVQALLDARGPRTSRGLVTQLYWSSRFHLQHRISAAPRKGRLLLCGDAAHVHSPAGGQGMNTGVQDAMALAAPLRDAIRTGDTSLLDQWAQRRHEVAQDVVRMTDRMTRAATATSGWSRRLRNALLMTVGHLPGATDALARRLSELDYA